MKIYSRDKGWNLKIKRLLGRVLKKKDKFTMKNSQIEEISVALLNPSIETPYSFSVLMTLPIIAQKFIIEQLYVGKKIHFLLKEGKIVGIRTEDANDSKYYQIS